MAKPELARGRGQRSPRASAAAERPNRIELQTSGQESNGINACIVLAIGTIGLGIVPLVAAMCCAGLLGGQIMPSRDMLVRAAAPPGAVGRTFGIVTSGLSIGGMIGPLMFGFIMDGGAPQWVFGASVIVMILIASVALISDRGSARRRAVRRAADPAE